VNEIAPISDENKALLVAYLDGDLSEEERRSVETLLSDDPILAAEFEAIATLELYRHALHGMEHRAARDRGPQRSSAVGRKLPGRWGLLAAAALLLLAFGLLLRSRVHDPSGPGAHHGARFRVAAVAGDSTLEDYHRRLGLPEEWVSGAQNLRSGGSGTEPDSEDYVAELRRTESERFREALETGARELEAAWFFMPFTAERPSSVLVIGLDERSGRAVREFPRGSTPKALASSWFERDGVHVLPEPSVRLEPSEGAPDRPVAGRGFLVRRSQGSRVFLFAITDRELLPEDLLRVDELLEDLPQATEAPEHTLSRHLRDEGFEVVPFRVHCP
jgi:hypothetical protein